MLNSNKRINQCMDFIRQIIKDEFNCVVGLPENDAIKMVENNLRIFFESFIPNCQVEIVKDKNIQKKYNVKLLKNLLEITIDFSENL